VVELRKVQIGRGFSAKRSKSLAVYACRSCHHQSIRFSRQRYQGADCTIGQSYRIQITSLVIKSRTFWSRNQAHLGTTEFRHGWALRRETESVLTRPLLCSLRLLLFNSGPRDFFSSPSHFWRCAVGPDYERPQATRIRRPTLARPMWSPRTLAQPTVGKSLNPSQIPKVIVGDLWYSELNDLESQASAAIQQLKVACGSSGRSSRPRWMSTRAGCSECFSFRLLYCQQHLGEYSIDHTARIGGNIQ